MTAIWRDAVFQLRKQLHQECLTKRGEFRRFQNRRLIENLVSRIQSERSSAAASVGTYWLLCGSPWQDHQLGYANALRQHRGELAANGFPPEIDPTGNRERVANELIYRIESLASWIEAEESWIFWCRATRQPQLWDREDPIAGRQAADAMLIAKMSAMTIDDLSDKAIADIIRSLQRWKPLQWVKILNMAARLAGDAKKPVSEREKWVWWRFPIFSRYEWSAAEVCRAAREKFGQRDDLVSESSFQSAWVRRGLRFAGKKRRRQYPPLWKFVLTAELPASVGSKYSLWTWIPYEKSSPPP